MNSTVQRGSLLCRLRMEGLPALTLWECVVDVFSPGFHSVRGLHGNQSHSEQLQFIDLVPPNCHQTRYIYIYIYHALRFCFAFFSKHSASLASETLQISQSLLDDQSFCRITAATCETSRFGRATAQSLLSQKAKPSRIAKSTRKVSKLMKKIGSGRISNGSKTLAV